jgi:hypothetical protein
MIAEFDQRCPSLVQVWTSLRNENTTTIDKLMAVAGRLERLVGVGPKAAQFIRDEIARVSAPEE